jgi:hypothetical protein
MEKLKKPAKFLRNIASFIEAFFLSNLLSRLKDKIAYSFFFLKKEKRFPKSIGARENTIKKSPLGSDGTTLKSNFKL